MQTITGVRLLFIIWLWTCLIRDDDDDTAEISGNIKIISHTTYNNYSIVSEQSSDQISFHVA